MSLDLLKQDVLQDIFREIRGFENLERKREAYECLQVYKERQKDLICKELCKEYEQETLSNMRTFTSLNLTRRIVHTEAAIYKKKPERMLSEFASDNEKEQMAALYHYADTNKKMKIANRYKVLFSQCAIQLVPKNGVIRTRVLTPYHYDVIPDPDDPEMPMAYIIQMNSRPGSSLNNSFDFEIKNGTSDGDISNQIIADDDDDALNALRYVVWSKDVNFISNGSGQIIDPTTGDPYTRGIEEEDVLSPLHEEQMLPFIDVSDQKDFEFWVNRGCQLAEFAIDIGKMDCDLAENNKSQGYSVPIISATHMPKSLNIGPTKALFLEKKPNGDPAKDPEFQFANPSPDLEGSINLRNAFINTMLRGRGLDSSVINTEGEAAKYSSGTERHMAKVERFEESQDDLDLFTKVEAEYFDIMRAWNNKLQGVSLEDGGLRKELNNGQLREELEITVKFDTPEMDQSKKELEESISARVKEGRLGIVEAVMLERGLDDRDDAIKVLEQIAEDKRRFGVNRTIMDSLKSNRRELSVEQEAVPQSNGEQSET